MVSDAIAKGDVNAINYFVAQKYVAAFAELARSPQQKTVIIPADMAGITGSIAGIGELIKTIGSDGPKGAPQPPRRGSAIPAAGG
jgi:regulator of protease activity HflC (stomatin/prohibitin superfamily)